MSTKELSCLTKAECIVYITVSVQQNWSVSRGSFNSSGLDLCSCQLTELMRHVVCLFTPQRSLVLTAQGCLA